jgi:hypothetical protein
MQLLLFAWKVYEDVTVTAFQIPVGVLHDE